MKTIIDSWRRFEKILARPEFCSMKGGRYVKYVLLWNSLLCAILIRKDSISLNLLQASD
jgi:hypothetical protein